MLRLEKVLRQRQGKPGIGCHQDKIKWLRKGFCVIFLLQVFQAVKDNQCCTAIEIGHAAISDTTISAFACGYVQMLSHPLRELRACSL